jgi:hypothetical protein
MNSMLMSLLVLGWRQHRISARFEDREFQRTRYLELMDHPACVKLYQYVSEKCEARFTANMFQLTVFALTLPNLLRRPSIPSLNRLLEYTWLVRSLMVIRPFSAIIRTTWMACSTSHRTMQTCVQDLGTILTV